MTSRRAHVIALAVFLTVLVVAGVGTAFANRNTVAVDCDGLLFDMPSGEAGTEVRVYLDGASEPVYSAVVARQFDPVRFSVASPDRSRPHSWVVVVDSVWNADQRIVRSWPACISPPTSTAPTTTSTTSTTVPSSTTTSTIPPAAATTSTLPPASTVVTLPRPTTTTAPWPSPVPLLPATGADPAVVSLIAAGAVMAGCVLLIIRATRRKRGAS
jgi:hypothetical protein